MFKLKFNELDRVKVISKVEYHFAVKLSPVGRYNKLLRDQSGRSFWVFGGYGNWHGFQEKILREDALASGDGVLVIAKHRMSEIDIYTGSLQPLIDNFHKLHHTSNGDHHFNVEPRGDWLHVKEVDICRLAKLRTNQQVERR